MSKRNFYFETEGVLEKKNSGPTEGLTPGVAPEAVEHSAAKPVARLQQFRCPSQIHSVHAASRPPVCLFVYLSRISDCGDFRV